MGWFGICCPCCTLLLLALTLQYYLYRPRCLRGACCLCSAKPPGRLWEVLIHALAILVHGPEIKLRICMSLLCSHFTAVAGL